MYKAVFLDKDGVLNADCGINPYPDEVQIFNYVPEVLAALKRAGFLLVMVTNQPVVARGLIDESELVLRLNRFNELTGSFFDRIEYCPHHPDADVPAYRINCDCRKPKPGMILRAAGDLDIDPSRSFLVGDRVSDIVAGKLAGVTTIQVLTGMETAPLIVSDCVTEGLEEPDFRIAGIHELPTILESVGQGKG